jgi:predicted signal transduction protein with EAL and GGDEF domain
LRQALDNNELSIEYQPCFDLQTLRTVSLEALLRWRTADGTYIPRFIPIAEQSNLIAETGDWVLRRVCLQLSEWQSAFAARPRVCQHLVRQFEKTPLASVVSGLAQEVVAEGIASAARSCVCSIIRAEVVSGPIGRQRR